ncbi:MAG: hypothetical protein U0746_03030 [Gemmataceae bacterium]
MRMTLVGADGNAFNLLGLFRRRAREQGWSQEKIQEVTDRATAADYSNLLAVLSEHIDDSTDDNSEDDEQ